MSNVLEVKERYIDVVVIHNPLEPYVSRKVGKLIWDNDKTLYDYLYDLPEDYDWVIIYNAKAITIEESKKIKPLPDTMLIVSPNLLGGGRNSSGKQTFRMIYAALIVVVATVVGFVASGFNPAGALAGFQLGMMAAGIYTTASSLIWNRPDLGNKKADSFEDTYGVDGAKTVAKEGIPVALCYGEYRIAGNCIQLRTENVGDTQDFYILQALSEGEVEAIENILVNEQPLNQFSNIEIEKRYGVPNQEIIPWFDDTYVSEYKGVEITTDWLYMRTTNKLDKFSIDITFPYGLYYSYVSESGNGSSAGGTVTFQVEYKSTSEDDNGWKRLGSTVSGYIKNIIEINDGDQFVFVDEYGVEHIYAFHGVIYKDFDTVYDGETLKQIYIYVPMEQYKTEDAIQNFIEAMKKSFVAVSPTGVEYPVPAPDLLCKYDKYSSGIYNLTFLPSGYTYNYSAWDIKVTNNTATPESFVSQNGNNITLTGFSTNPIRRTISSGRLKMDYYDVRIRRTTAKAPTQQVIGKFTHTSYTEAIWTNLNEIILDDIQYNYTALMGVKVRLDGQLSSTPNITADVKGIKCGHYDYDGTLLETKWTANPAWIAVDLLTNERYGGSIDVSRIDMPKFIEWAEYCEENDIEFNGYFSTNSNLWDVLKSVLMVGHASLVICGTKFSLAIDKPREAVYLFNNSNIVKDSLSTSWSGLADRANSLTLTYYNKDDNYKQTSIKIVDSESVSSQKELKEISTTIMGITKEAQARMECKRLSLRNKYLQQSVEFAAPIESVGCSVGDVIIVQHDVPQWGYGGKLKPNSTVETLNLDRTVTMKDDQEYMVLIHHDAVKRLDTIIQSVVGKSVFIPGKFTEKARRLICDDKDIEIIQIIPGSPFTEIIVSNAENLVAGSNIELWDTDVLEEAEVVTDAYKELSTIVLRNPLKWEPKTFSNWLFGYKDRYQKKFAITSMSGLNTEQIKITGQEYSDAFYDYDNYEGNDPIISDISTRIEPVYNLSATEELIKNGSSFTTDVIISWDTALLNTYFGADIYIRKTEELPFEKIGEAQNGTSTYRIQNLNDGDTIQVKVVAYDGAGRRADFNASPIISYTVLGKNKAPATPKNFEIRKTSQGLMLAWDVVNEADVVGYIIKSGTEWVSGTLIDENISNNRYTIQYTEAGTKNFMVKAKDAFGNESEAPAYATITLDPPLDPIDFMSVQNNDFIVLKWNNLDETVVKFRIKEGESWGSGTIVADVAGYSHSVPINGYYNRKFWIKSIDQFGVFSANAVYTSPMAIEHQTKNIIVTYDESGDGFPHPRLNMDLINDDLIVRENTKYGEYNWYVDIGEELYSRIISEDEVDAIAYSPKWKDFHNRWNSYEAQSPWVVKASLDNVQIERQMALPSTSLPADVLESFPFYFSPDGEVMGTQPIEAITYRYSNGRFREGIVVDDQGSLGYNINIPEIFSVKFWVRPRLLVSSGYIELLNTETGALMHLYYSDTTRAFTLEDSNEETLTVNTDFSRDEPILICISQSATTRILMVGFSKDLKILSQSKSLAPLGSFNQMNLR